MPEYRRLFIPGGTFFFTLVTFERIPILSFNRRGEAFIAIFLHSVETCV